MAVEFWLIRGREILRLPVNPESLQMSSPFNYTDLDVEGIGEITMFGRRAQREYTIETFWPSKYNPVYCSYSGFISPGAFIKRIEDWRGARKPIRLVVTGARRVNEEVTIRDFTIDADRNGSPGDIYFTLTLKEYREIKIERVDLSKKKTKNNKQRSSKSKDNTPKSYVVKKNESLWIIAKKVYGDGDKWRKIYDANKKKIGANPNKLEVGMKLVIPS